MLDAELKEKLIHSGSLEEVRELLKGESGLDAEKAWEEVRRHHSDETAKLDLEELASVSGGADRNWVKDGCAATCEAGSWCGSNDYCMIWDVTYDNFWATCPDGHDHVFQNRICIRCGYERSGGDFTGN